MAVSFAVVLSYGTGEFTVGVVGLDRGVGGERESEGEVEVGQGGHDSALGAQHERNLRKRDASSHIRPHEPSPVIPLNTGSQTGVNSVLTECR